MIARVCTHLTLRTMHRKRSGGLAGIAVFLPLEALPLSLFSQTYPYKPSPSAFLSRISRPDSRTPDARTGAGAGPKQALNRSASEGAQKKGRAGLSVDRSLRALVIFPGSTGFRRIAGSPLMLQSATSHCTIHESKKSRS